MRKYLPLLFIINFALGQVTVDGNAYLENQTEHDSILVLFERTVPSSLLDTAYTVSDGYYSVQLETGIYNVNYSKDGYFTESIIDQQFYSNTTLPDVSLLEHTTILNVPLDYSTIQAGINAAIDGDTVLVAAGTYIENINFIGKNIVVGSIYLTTGDTSYISLTIIDGNQNGSVVTFSNGEDTAAVLSGFTIQNGNSLDYGGGIYCNGSSPKLTYLIVTENNAYSGAGIQLFSSEAILEELVVSDNTATDTGGGIRITSGAPILYNLQINGNNALYAGGIQIYDSNDAILENIVIQGNMAGEGGGLYILGCSPFLNNSTITENFYSGIYLSDGAPSLVNTIVSDNTGSYGIYVESGNPSITYSDLYNNQNGNCYNCGDWVGVNVTTNANGDSCDAYYNIQEDPLFVDATNGDYNLQQGSPCIDAGDPTSTYDADGSIADMGAFPSAYGTPVVPIVINVPDDYTTIQAGINAAIDGDTVLVAAGTYNEHIIWTNINGIKLLSISGADSTFIEGNATSEERIIKIDSGVDSSTVIKGFTIKNGKGGIHCLNSSPQILDCKFINNYFAVRGGGIYLEHSNSIIRNVLLKDNIARKGGGINFYNSNSTLDSITMIGNSAYQYYGGGINIENGGSVTITNSTIVENSSSGLHWGGGGISSWGGTFWLSNVTIANNHTIGIDGGAGIYLAYGNMNNDIGVNCIIYGNTWGGGNVLSSQIYNPYENNINYSNIQNGYEGEGNIDVDPLFCNPDSGDYTLVENSPCVGTGENGANMGALGVGCDAYNFSPTEFSLSTPSNNVQITIDDSNMNDGFITFSWGESSDENGDSLVYLMHATSTDLEDFSLDTNITSIDMLYYMEIVDEMSENNITSATIEWTVDVTDGIDTVTANNAPFTLIVDGSDALSTLAEKLIPEVFALHQNYPNPFNPVTTLRYDLPEDALVNITIYDMMGRQVKTLVNGSQTAGYRTIQWNATNDRNEPVSSGLYIYTIQAGKFRQTKKMVLLK